jgi:acetyl-CoA acyltransferase
MESAVIVDAVRTPIGKRHGQLSGWHPVDLLATLLSALVERADIDPVLVDDVIVGCVSQVGAQSANIGRSAVLAANFPESVPATTIDRQCGSSQQAIHFAAQGIMAGAYDVVIAAGVECMSIVPMDAGDAGDYGDSIGVKTRKRYIDHEFAGVRGFMPLGLAAEYVSERWNLTRDELDRFAFRSHTLATRARNESHFKNEIIEIKAQRRDPHTGQVSISGQLVDSDEGIRETSLEQLSVLKTPFKLDGKVTAGNSSQISDGAAAVLITSESMANKLGLRPRARVVDFAVVGSDPIAILTGPIAATARVCARSGLNIDSIDRIQISEAFASAVLAWEKELHPDPDRVNVNGGAIALGHPLGASGARLMATLLNELEQSRSRFGLQTMCEGGGMANATIIERLD